MLYMLKTTAISVEESFIFYVRWHSQTSQSLSRIIFSLKILANLSDNIVQ